MTKIRYTATHNGQTFTRTSARIYTHMTAARPSYDYALQAAQSKGHAIQDARNFNYFLARSQGQAGFRPGTIAEVEGYKFRNDPAEVEAFVEAEKARALESLGGATTVEDYQRAQALNRLGEVEGRRAAGYYTKFQDYGWSGRLDLAQKNAASAQAKPFWAEVVILEAQRKN
jgi:hypothetical protein